MTWCMFMTLNTHKRGLFIFYFVYKKYFMKLFLYILLIALILFLRNYESVVDGLSTVSSPI